MANYYGYSAGTNNQQYSLPGTSNTSYGNTAYNLPPPQTNQYITHQNIQQQPQPQQQQAFVTYGQIGQSNPTYPSYNYSNTGSNQATSYGKVAQTPQYYQTTTTSARPSMTPGYFNNSQPTPQNRMYESTYTQQIQTPLQQTTASPPVPPPPQQQQQQQQVPINRVNSANMVNNYRSTSTAISRTNNMPSNYGMPARQSQNNNSGYGSNIVNNNGNIKSSGTYGNSTTSKSGNPAESKSMSNYEKALLNVASTMYQQQRRGGGGVNKGGFLPKWRQNKREKDPNKPIIATEVKGYLYAWLSKRRQRPDYNITAHGSSQFRQSYVCELMVNGHQYVGKGTASNKKDSQTRAAWDFCDNLIRDGKMSESELPNRESKFEASKNKLPPTYNKDMTDQERVTTIAKKKVVAQKINFVGGSTLKLSDTNANPIGTSITPTIPKVETVDASYPESGKSIYNIGPQSNPKQKDNSKNGEKNDNSSSKKNEPVGEDYVTQVWTDGRVIRYRCSLCECEFNDPCAKELHVRGRRHKLSYKTKVDASLEVDVKLNPRQKNIMMMKLRQESRQNAFNERRNQQKQWELEKKKQEEHDHLMYEEEMFYQYQGELIRYEEEVEFHRRRSLSLPLHIVPPIRPIMRFFQSKLQKSQQIRTSEDQHVMAKHQRIYPTEKELIMVQDTVQLLETAFKEVSTSIHEQEIKVYAIAKSAQINPTPERLLKTVLRMGNLAKGLLLRGDLNVELVLMCNSKPTATLLHRVADNLPKHLGTCPEKRFDFKTDIDDCCIKITTKEDPVINVKVYLTSTLMRPPSDDATTTTESTATTTISKPDPPDILDVHKCCLALASLRHAKWFQAKATGLPSCVLTTRIFKDLCVRVPTWSPLSSWAIELLVERVISSSSLPLSPSVAVKRVFEVLASGTLLPGGPGISDPCERVPTDAADNLSAQEREDITGSAQHALRLLAFQNIHKVLAMEKLPTKDDSRKRKEQMKEEEDVKKMKME